jgi:hypothetical protein
LHGSPPPGSPADFLLYLDEIKISAGLCWNTRSHKIVGFAEEPFDFAGIMNETAVANTRDDSEKIGEDTSAKKKEKAGTNHDKNSQIATHVNQFLICHET